MDKIRGSGIGDRKNIVWMHCASLGEFEQGRPVLEALKAANPGISTCITFFSPSGYEAAKDYRGADFLFYLPLDSAFAAKRFLNQVNPVLVLWVKYEYWYHYLSEMRRRKIPVLLVSPLFRREQPFFKWYGNLHRQMLDSFHAFFVQNQESEILLRSLHIKQPVIVTGDTRFDRVATIAAAFTPLPAISTFCGEDQVIVAGSTWEEDEEELDHYANTHPHIRFIIVPHEIGEEHLCDIEKLFTGIIRYSVWIKSDAVQAPAEHVLLVDNVGMLSRLYHYATICYVGGGFGDDGVHNVLEAAVYDKVVVTGPEIDKFIEVEELAEKGGVIVIENALEAETVFNKLLGDATVRQRHGDAAGRYVKENRGATAKIIRYIQENRLLTSS